MLSPTTRSFAAALLALALAGGAAWAQTVDSSIRDVLGGDPAAYKQVIEGFQAAVKAGDAAAAAGFVSYPIEVTVGGARRKIVGPADFVANYTAIVTPAIARAIASEPLEDMMVNDQGVMLGDGEVWVGGLCLDTACETSEVKVITIQAGPDTAAAPAAETAPLVVGALRTFGDWVVGCDNFRACAALGLSPDEGPSGYVVVKRGGAGEDAPLVYLNVLASDAPADPSLQLAFGAGKARFPKTALPVETQGGFLVAAIDPAMAPDLIAALATSTRLDLIEIDGMTAGDPQRISLRGSAAALLYMDDQQKRVGTVTALIKPGLAAAASIPPVPAASGPAPVAMTALPDPLPPPPPGITPPSDPSCAGGFDPMAFALSGTETLWAVCAQAGAHNIDYTMWLVGPSGATKADFSVPGQDPGDDPSILTNPSLNPDELGLNTLQKGEGIGDCGVMADWGWTGGAFTLLQYREMDICRGVDQSDWPVLYRAEPL